MLVDEMTEEMATKAYTNLEAFERAVRKNLIESILMDLRQIDPSDDPAETVGILAAAEIIEANYIS